MAGRSAHHDMVNGDSRTPFDRRQEFGKGEIRAARPAARRLEQVEDGDQKEPDNHPQRKISTDFIHLLSLNPSDLRPNLRDNRE